MGHPQERLDQYCVVQPVKPPACTPPCVEYTTGRIRNRLLRQALLLQMKQVCDAEADQEREGGDDFRESLRHTGGVYFDHHRQRRLDKRKERVFHRSTRDRAERQDHEWHCHRVSRAHADWRLDGTEKDPEDDAERVQRGQQCPDHADDPETRMSLCCGPSAPDDEIFAVEPGRDEGQSGE